MMINQQILTLIRQEEVTLRFRRRDMFNATTTERVVSNIRAMNIEHQRIHRWKKDLTNKEWILIKLK